MNDLQIFNSEQFGQVRVVMKNNEPWFVAKDVCNILDISKDRDAVSRLDEDERGSVLLDTLGGKQNVNAINEYGLYNLIFGSRKQEAKQFKRWVTHEVLPEIRKTGSYSIHNEIAELKKQVNYLLSVENLQKNSNFSPKDYLIRFFQENCEVNPTYHIININFYIKYQEWCRRLGIEPIKDRDIVFGIITDRVPEASIDLFHLCYALCGIAWKDKRIYQRGIL